MTTDITPARLRELADTLDARGWTPDGSFAAALRAAALGGETDE